ncbi:unnamed protein product [Larinioides sclopetarius]|uniref:Cytochrome P450 n=1 Tax=Larinioides sclopetarius TaxID=280406 RepID=A0AAV2B557_9ARAC
MLGEEVFVEPFIIRLFLATIALFFLYWYTTKGFDYWKKRGIPYVKPVVPFLGSLLPLFWRPSFKVDLERYRKLGPIYGQFDGSRPVLAVADLELVREILVKEFPSFTDRRISHFLSDTDVLKSMLFVLSGEEWKQMRAVLSPCFTPAKIKRVVNIIKECAQVTAENFRTAAKSGKSVQVKKFYVTYAMDVIASAAFSVQLDSYNDPRNKFFQNAEKAFSTHFNMKYAFHQLCPRLAKWCGVQVISQEPLYYFKEVVLQIIKHRRKTGETRNDFLQFMLDTMKEDSQEPKEDIGNGNDYEKDKNSKKIANKGLTLDEAVAQSVSFFIAGYDTMASTVSYVTYLLALHPEAQDRTFEEIRDALQETKGELTYGALQEMKYLDNVISESMRLYPAVPRLERTATSDCTLGDTGIKIEKGMVIIIPTYCLHRDPNLFENPEKFDPDRFLWIFTMVRVL